MKCSLTETSFSGTLKVDRTAGVIHGVRILGKQSKNGYEYSDRAMEQAAKLYEGAKVRFDHPERKNPGAERSFREGFGELRGVKREGDAVFGDLHYIKSHPLAEMTAEAAERFPNQFGLSHNADGEKQTRGGKTVVESVDLVRSVDIVDRPATNRGIFESENFPVKKTIKQILEAMFPSKKAVLVEMEGDASGPMPMASEVEMPAESSSDDQIKAAFRNAVVAAFDDDKLDSKATLKKIGEIIKAHDKLTGKGEPSGGGDPPKGKEPVKESVNDPALASVLDSVAKMQRRELIRDILEESGVSPRDLEPERRKLLESQADEASMRALVKSWPPVVKHPRHGHGGPIRESVTAPAVPSFKSPQDLAAFLRN